MRHLPPLIRCWKSVSNCFAAWAFSRPSVREKLTRTFTRGTSISPAADRKQSSGWQSPSTTPNGGSMKYRRTSSLKRSPAGRRSASTAQSSNQHRAVPSSGCKREVASELSLVAFGAQLKARRHQGTEGKARRHGGTEGRTLAQRRFVGRSTVAGRGFTILQNTEARGLSRVIPFVPTCLRAFPFLPLRALLKLLPTFFLWVRAFVGHWALGHSAFL